MYKILQKFLGHLFNNLSCIMALLLVCIICLPAFGISDPAVIPTWRTQFLATITEPDIAYLLLIVGIYGLFFEFVNPGFMLPGVIGGIAFLIAMYAFHLLPVSYVGLCLILLGVAFMAGELFVPSGALSIGGMIAFVSGSILLFDMHSTLAISWFLIATMSILTAVFFFIVISVAIRARYRKVVSGRETLVGSIGEVHKDFQADGTGWIFVQSETWQARAAIALRRGQRVRVVAVKGLILEVEPVNS